MNAFSTFLKRYNHFELISNQLYFTVSDNPIESTDSEVLFTISDYPDEFSFNNNCPPSLKQIYIFINMLDKIIEMGNAIHFYSTISNLSNSLVLVCCFMIVKTKQMADLTFAPFSLLSALIKPYQGIDEQLQKKPFNLTVVACIRSFEKAIKNKWFQYDSFNIKKYEYFQEQNMNWIIPNFLLSFTSNPLKTISANKAFLSFHKLRINHLVSINDTAFDLETIKNYGFDFNQISIKSIIPSAQAIKQFFNLISNSDHTFAIHSHSTIDLSGVFCACLLVQNYNFAPDEAIAWAEMCQSNALTNGQQLFVSEFKDQLKNLATIEIAPPSIRPPLQQAPRSRIRSALAPSNKSTLPVSIKTPQAQSIGQFSSSKNENMAVNINQALIPNGPNIQTKKNRAPPRNFSRLMINPVPVIVA